MAAAVKKKNGAKDRGGLEGAAGVANVQSIFVSAARETVWHADTIHHASHNSAAPNSQSTVAPRVHTAASNAMCGRPHGATQSESPWTSAEAQTHTSDCDKALPSTAAWEAERAVFQRLFAHPSQPPPGEGDGTAREVQRAESDALYEDWLHHIAAHRPSPLRYPHHTLHFEAPEDAAHGDADSSTADPCMYVAAVLHQLLTAYFERCSAHEQSQQHHRHGASVPPRVFATMLYNSVYNNNFATPPAEHKDVTFSAAAAATATEGQRQHSGAKGVPRRRRYDAVSVITSLGVSHLCVCVGRHYYKLSVVEERTGNLRSVRAIADGLEAIRQHHRAQRTEPDRLAGASPTVLQDRDAIESMFAGLSMLTDSTAFDVRRRLRESSAVNACTLDALQGGLCTLVLRCEEDAAAEPVARWLHSACSLEVSLCQPQQWTLRLHAAVVPCEAGVEWLTRAFANTARPPVAVAAQSATSTGAVGDAQPEPAEGLRGLSVEALTTPVDGGGLAEHLELWLPEKHRVPLRPYPTPPWDPASTQTAVVNQWRSGSGSAGGCTVEHVVMTLLQVAVEAKKNRQLGSCSSSSSSSGAQRQWPSVVLAVQPVRGGAPSLARLDTPAVQHYYEALLAPPLMYAAATRRRIEADAIAEVRALLNIVAYATTTVQPAPSAVTSSSSSLPSSSWWAALETEPADVCISLLVLPRASAAGTIKLRVISDLAVPSVLSVSVTAQQAVAETHVRASASRVTDVVVQANTPAATEVGRSISRALALCKQTV